jgi:hypothetical protein
MANDDAWMADLAADRILNTPLMDYQRDEIARITERLDDTRYTHRTIVAIWPRRTGKTTSILAVTLGRLLFTTGYRAAYTEKTGHDVSLRFADWIDLVERQPAWRARFKTRKSAGTERITHRQRRGFVRAFPPSPDKLRGDAMDLVILDEAQHHDDTLGQQLDASIGPTMDTRPRRQLIITGTAGGPDSTYFRRHYDAAVAGAPGYLLSEIGTWPDTADPADPATWWEHHPGLRAGLTTQDALAENLGRLGPDRFAREYGNRWATVADNGLIDPAEWAAGAWTRNLDQPPTRFAVAYDAAWDRSAGTILAAWPDPDTPDLIHLEVVDHRPGTAWMADRLADLHKRRRARLSADSASPAKDVTRQLQARKIPVTELPTGDYTAACAELATHVTAGTVTHRPDAALDLAATGARRRNIGDRWVFDRRTALDVSPITAAAVAHYQARRPARAPVMV